MLYQVKARFQKMVRWVAGDWMTANQATIFGWIAMAATGAALYVGLTSAPWCLLLVLPLSIVRLVMNALDGMLARAQGTASAVGELLNEVSDVVGDTLSYGVLAFVPDVAPIPLMVFLIGIWASEFMGVMPRGLPGAKRRHESLGGGKPERGLWISLAAIWIYVHPSDIARLGDFLAFVSVLIALTCVARLRATIREVRGRPYQSYTPSGV